MRTLLVCDIDGTLTPEPAHDASGVELLRSWLRQRESSCYFAAATGRGLTDAVDLLTLLEYPLPDMAITHFGAELYNFHSASADAVWADAVGRNWNPDSISESLRAVRGLSPLHPMVSPMRLSFETEPAEFLLAECLDALVAHRSSIRILMLHAKYLEILPRGASKGRAVRYLSKILSVPASRTFVFGDSGNDRDMLDADFHATVVANYSEELEELRHKNIYFSPYCGAAGVFDGVQHYKIGHTLRAPEAKRPSGASLSVENAP